MSVSASKMSNNETPFSALWHSELVRVENLPFRIIPDLVQATEKFGEIPSVIN